MLEVVATGSLPSAGEVYGIQSDQQSNSCTFKQCSIRVFLVRICRAKGTLETSTRKVAALHASRRDRSSTPS